MYGIRVLLMLHLYDSFHIKLFAYLLSCCREKKSIFGDNIYPQNKRRMTFFNRFKNHYTNCLCLPECAFTFFSWPKRRLLFAENIFTLNKKNRMTLLNKQNAHRLTLTVHFSNEHSFLPECFRTHGNKSLTKESITVAG